MSKNEYPYQNRSLSDMKGEVWEDIPFLDGAYIISNYGRVKALQRWVERAGNKGFWLSDKILSTRIQLQKVSGGKRILKRLSVIVSYEKKKYHIAIARMVYNLFVEKFDLADRSIFISYKDENPFNIHPANLLLTNPSDTITSAYRRNHRSRDAFGNKAFSITQFDTNGKKLNTFQSIQEAASAAGITSSGLSDVLKKGHGFGGGFIWRYGTNKKQLSTIPPEVNITLESKKLHSSIISQYDLTGKKVKEHASIKAAALVVKTQPNSIKNVILGNSFSCKGYHWKLGKGPNKINITPILEKQQEKRKKSICRPVSQYEVTGKRICTYESVAEAARAMGVTDMSIHAALKENGPHCKGFIWKYD